MNPFIKLHRRARARHPTATPRKHAISTILVKNVRKTTMLPNQRMHASSKNRIRKLMRNNSTVARRTLGMSFEFDRASLAVRMRPKRNPGSAGLVTRPPTVSLASERLDGAWYRVGPNVMARSYSSGQSAGRHGHVRRKRSTGSFALGRAIGVA